MSSMEQCTICKSVIPQNGEHYSPWSFVPCDVNDVHLRNGSIVCSECYLEMWGTVQFALKNVLLWLKDSRFGKPAKVMPSNRVAPDTEAIFRKVVAADSPPSAAQLLKG